MTKPYTEERFRARFFARIGPPDASGCRLWLGARSQDGYGQVNQDGKTRVATHVALELHDGRLVISGVDCVLHSCDNPPCCEPAHLRRGTRAENARDRDARGRTAKGDCSGSARHPEVRLRGEQHPRARLNAARVLQIRTRCASGESMLMVARAMGVKHGTVHAVVTRRTWKHVL